MALAEIRISGRGGQGVVSAGELLGRAALRQGRWAQSIPSFGPERRGAPCVATLRVDDSPIRLKCTSSTPGTVLVLDPSIWRHAPIFLGVTQGATVVINSPQPAAELCAVLRAAGALPAVITRVCAVDATGLALQHLGRPITNTAMMGALAAASELFELEAVASVLGERFGEANVAVARAAAAQLSCAIPQQIAEA